MTPDGVQGNSIDSSRFLTYEIEKNALQLAENTFQRTGISAFTFDMQQVIGEGYLRGSVIFMTTSKVRAVFVNGKIYTLYPKLR